MPLESLRARRINMHIFCIFLGSGKCIFEDSVRLLVCLKHSVFITNLSVISHLNAKLSI